MNENINEKDTENFVMPEIKTMTEAEQTAQRKTDEKHVSGMNPLKKFAIGAAMAVGLTLGAAIMTTKEQPTKAINYETVVEDRGLDPYPLKLRPIMEEYNRNINRILAMAPFQLREDSQHQLDDVFQCARITISNSNDLSDEAQTRFRNYIAQMQGMANTQLNLKFNERKNSLLPSRENNAPNVQTVLPSRQTNLSRPNSRPVPSIQSREDNAPNVQTVLPSRQTNLSRPNSRPVPSIQSREDNAPNVQTVLPGRQTNLSRPNSRPAPSIQSREDMER